MFTFGGCADRIFIHNAYTRATGTKHEVSVLRRVCDNQAVLNVLAMGTYEKQNLQQENRLRGQADDPAIDKVERGASRVCKCPSKLLSTCHVQAEASKAMGNQCLSVAGFESAKLVWPPVVLGDASWLMTWSEQVNSQRIQCAVLAGRNPS